MAFRVGNREDAERALQHFVSWFTMFFGTLVLNAWLKQWLSPALLSFLVAAAISALVAGALNASLIICLHALWPPKDHRVTPKSKAPKRRRPKPLQEMRDEK